MTFSVAGVCADTQMVGCAISSSSICVASRCAFVRSRTGAVLTQNVTNPALGPIALDLLSRGFLPEKVLEELAAEDPGIQWRQIGILNSAGKGISFSGTQALRTHATAQGEDCIALGNLLGSVDVPTAMIECFESSRGHLAERLLQALEAGLSGGGELGPVRSAGLLVAAEPAWPIIDLRVDWHADPIGELRALWHRYRPQVDAYVTRANDPANAESYDVPGDA